MATEKKKNTVVYPRTNHDETFDSLGVHRIGDFEDLYRRSRSTEQCDKDTNEGNIETMKVYSEELIREFVDIIFKKEISAINGILQETKYSFLPEKIQEISKIVDDNIADQLKDDLQRQKDFNMKKEGIMKDIQMYTEKVEKKQKHLSKIEKEIKQWETIRKEREIKKMDFVKDINDEDDNKNTKNNFQLDDSTLQLIENQRDGQDIKDRNYFKAADEENMDDEENRIILSCQSNNGEKSQTLERPGTKNLDELVTLPTEQYQLAVSSLHENALQMKERVDHTMETISQAAQNQSSLYRTFKMVQFSSYGKGIVAPIEALRQELSSETTQEN